MSRKNTLQSLFVFQFNNHPYVPPFWSSLSFSANINIHLFCQKCSIKKVIQNNFLKTRIFVNNGLKLKNNPITPIHVDIHEIKNWMLSRIRKAESFCNVRILVAFLVFCLLHTGAKRLVDARWNNANNGSILAHQAWVNIRQTNPEKDIKIVNGIYSNVIIQKSVRSFFIFCSYLTQIWQLS